MKTRLLFIAFLACSVSFGQRSQYYAKNQLSDFDLVGKPKQVKVLLKRRQTRPFTSVHRDTTVLTFTDFGKLTKTRSYGLIRNIQSFGYNEEQQLIEVRNHYSDDIVRYADSIVYSEFDSIQTIYSRYNTALFKSSVTGKSDLYTPDREYHYDSLNRPYLVIDLFSNDSISRMQRMTYEDGIVEYSSDRNSEYEHWGSDCQRDFLDDRGNTIQSDYYSSRYGFFLTQHFTYDSLNRLVAVDYEDDWAVPYWEEDQPRYGVVPRRTGYTATYRYDSQGRKVYLSEGDHDFEDIREYDFDSAGRKIREEHKYRWGKEKPASTSLIINYEYDDEGQLRRIVKTNGQGKKWRVRFKYDDQGNWIKRKEGGEVTKRSIEYYL